MWGCRLGSMAEGMMQWLLLTWHTTKDISWPNDYNFFQEGLCSIDSVIICGHDRIKGSYHPRTDQIALEITQLCTSTNLLRYALYLLSWKKRRQISFAYFPCFIREHRIMACMCPPCFRPVSEASEPSVWGAAGAQVNADISLILILYV